ncbi:protein kinase [Actinopolymorpha sp. B17G11]|uniref:serine/threonine protein kinase n=1 Tax=unclassified Actinopolymorpha TaxID=2627063 RepID=UPI0032D9301B
MQGDFRVDGYDIEGLLGAGPAGEVWLARDVAAGSQVALKRVHPRNSAAHDEARRIVSVLDSVAHPHVLRISEMLPVGDALVFVCDYAEGGSLGQLLLARTTLDPGEVVTMATAIAGALTALHERGLVHTDVTPENVLFSADARPLLADAGLLGLVEGGAELGTLGYADPGQRPGAEPVPAADIYGLAAVCYTALAGTPPEPGQGRRPLHQVAPGVPPALAHVVEAGLAGQPDQRPNAAQFGAQLASACPAVPVRFPDGLASSSGAPSFEEPSPASFGPTSGTGDLRGSGRSADPWRGMSGTQASDAEPGGSAVGDPLRGAAPGPGPVASDQPDAFAGLAPSAPRDAVVGDAEDEDDGRFRKGRGVLIAALVGVPVALAGVAALGVLGWQALAGPKPSPTETPPTASSSPSTGSAAPSSSPRTEAEARWTQVLTALDERRAEAWRKLDQDGLSQVYKPGSRALQEELDTMRVHASKGVTSVEGLSTPIQSLEVVSESPDRVVVDAVSQLQPYSLEVDGQLYPHDGGEPRRFRMTLEPDGSGGWLIAGSKEIGPA